MPSSNKIALITGANKGIGFEVARQLGKQNCTVLVGARDAKLGEEAVAKLKKEGIEAVFVALDVTRRETIEAARAGIEKEFGKLDILVTTQESPIAAETGRRAGRISTPSAAPFRPTLSARLPLRRPCCR